MDILNIDGESAGLTAKFDSGHYPNGAAKRMHTVPTWDHQHPDDFRGAAGENIMLENKSTALEDVAIEELLMAEDGYIKAVDKHGNYWISMKVILATGVMDF